jgi:hypothetical protein
VLTLTGNMRWRQRELLVSSQRSPCEAGGEPLCRRLHAGNRAQDDCRTRKRKAGREKGLKEGALVGSGGGARAGGQLEDPMLSRGAGFPASY